MNLPFHPAADLFPLLTGDALQELADDIRTNGLLEAIVMHDGKVLDGRNRLAACELAEVEPRFVDWSGDGGTPLRYVLSHNLHRRHLTTSQRAAIGVEVLPMFEEEAQKRMLAGRSDPIANRQQGLSSEEAGSAMNVSARSVQRAKRIKEVAPEQFDKIKSGELNIEQAHRAAGLGSTNRAYPEGGKTKQNGAETTSRKRIGPGAEERRMEDFDRAYGVLTAACASAPSVDVPPLSPERGAELSAELRRAARCVHDFRHKIEEMSK